MMVGVIPHANRLHILEQFGKGLLCRWQIICLQRFIEGTEIDGKGVWDAPLLAVLCLNGSREIGQQLLQCRKGFFGSSQIVRIQGSSEVFKILLALR